QDGNPACGGVAQMLMKIVGGSAGDGRVADRSGCDRAAVVAKERNPARGQNRRRVLSRQGMSRTVKEPIPSRLVIGREVDVDVGAWRCCGGDRDVDCALEDGSPGKRIERESYIPSVVLRPRARNVFQDGQRRSQTARQALEKRVDVGNQV